MRNIGETRETELGTAAAQSFSIEEPELLFDETASFRRFGNFQPKKPLMQTVSWLS